MVDGKISVVLPQNLDTPFLSYCIRDDMNISWGSRQKIVVSDEMTIELKSARLYNTIHDALIVW